MKKALIILSLFCASAYADTSIGINTITLHVPKVENTTAYTPGVYVVQDNTTIGVYRNSYKNVSMYAGYSYQYSANTSIIAGVLTGYPICRKTYGICPGAAIKYLVPVTENTRMGFTFSAGTAAVAINYTLEYKL
ncbi:hypothetical protein UFOVP273_93 [uncultured Caudovirales phage]|uniref:Uncharacterized protein n=1 Tax=uncultured Caudovirales phage TaxID=2100421 RepID=A0A6J5LIS7_9CAUD|nr:hypothetical protein UFOVP273_93 [uncultured Caudovirales phage]